MENKEMIDALLELKKAVIDLKGIMYDANQKMSKVANDSHLKSAMTMLDGQFEFRDILDRSNNPRRHR